MRQAIIDIGSNAIRAVVYDNKSLGAPEIYNDKFRSDLISLLELDNLDVKHHTYLTLQYFSNIFQQLDVTQINCVATAVLRDHPKSESFIKLVKEKYDINIDIISGEREARLSALGLISGVTDANGIAVDLGGGSLEIIEINNKKVGELRSLELGTKKIDSSTTLEYLVDTINATFPHKPSCPNLYLIGGGLRFIGRHYMEFVRYPLRNLHNLEINIADFLIYLEKIESISKIQTSYQTHRIDNNATLIAKALVKVLNPEKVVISNYGLKEGVRFMSLSEEEQAKNIIFERCKSLAAFNQNTCQLDKYNKLITQLLINPDKLTNDVVNLSVILASFGKNIDRTLKAHFTAEFILSSDIPFNHRQRLMLGLATSHAFSSKKDLFINKLAQKILSELDYNNSQIIGNILRIAKDVDGPAFKHPSFNLQLRDRFIEITTNEILPKPIFESVCNRLKDVAFARKIAQNSLA